VRIFRTPDSGMACQPDYAYEVRAGGAAWRDVGGFSSECSNQSPGYKFSGLTPATTYVLSVRAYHLVDGVKVYSPAASLTTSTTTIEGFVAPSAPRSVTTLVAPASGVGSGEVHLRWEVPAADGGSQITDYLIERSADGTAEWVPIDDEVSPTRNATVTGLSNGTTYYFRVLAVNAVGTGLASTVVNATPRTVPGAPESLTATPGNGVIQLAWLPPASTGGSSITDYLIERSADGTSGWVTIEELISSVRSTTVTGLSNGTSYYFRVLAANEVGRSTASDTVTDIPRTVASPPESVTATPGASGQVHLAWSAPSSNGGADVTDYVIQRSTGTSWGTVTDGVSATTDYTATGLTNGTRYYFRVAAYNAAGSSAFSNTANATPRTVPTAVLSLTATPTNHSGQVRLAWTAPSSTGGAAITDYVIQRLNGTSWVTVTDGVTTTTTTISGLSNGTRYSFRVLATNAAGHGPSSNVVTQTPRTVPTAPRTLTATPTSTRVVLRWTPPTSTGGAPITRYAIQRSTNPTSGWIYLTTAIPPTARSFTATNLRNGTRYYFRIVAINTAGPGPWSAPTNATPR
jgi:titin